MSTTVKLRCNCKHEDQDRLNGAGIRLHNRCKPKEKEPVWRCTVCGTERRD